MPVGREVREFALESDRCLDVRQRVATERHERVAPSDRPATEDRPVDAGDPGVGVRPVIGPHHPPEPCAIELSIRQPRRLRDHRDRNRREREPQPVCHRRVHGTDVVGPVVHGDHDPVVVAVDRGGDALLVEDPADVSQVDPEAEDLEEVAAAPHDLEQAVVGDAADVPGAQ